MERVMSERNEPSTQDKRPNTHDTPLAHPARPLVRPGPHRASLEFVRTLVGVLVLTVWTSIALAAPTSDTPLKHPSHVEISFSHRVHAGAVTGRIFLLVSRRGDPEPRLQGFYLDAPEFLGLDAKSLEPDQPLVLDDTTVGYPLRALRDLPPGDYYVQAFANLYTEYPRADGHTIWALDQWESQDFTRSPGNLYSAVQHAHLDPGAGIELKLTLTEVVPAATPPVDTPWLRYIKIKSPSLSKFWGRPIYLGAIVLLPRDYATHPDARYPVIYYQKHHVMRDGPFDFSTENSPETPTERNKRESLGYETGYEFYQAWNASDMPRMIAVTFINPTPYYDFSSVRNSANNGPYGDAIMTELIPYIEDHFRIIREPYARVLVGKSSGGRDALALQLLHSQFFGGAWIFYPWAFDYRHYFILDIYSNKNAFVVDPSETQGFRDSTEWSPLERYFPRTTDDKPLYTMRDYALHEAVQGGSTGVNAELTGSDDALNGPLGPNGYPKPLYDKTTGAIDPEVARYWREHGDLLEYAKTHWGAIGPQLTGKLHFYVGDMDEWSRNFGVRAFEDFLHHTTSPHVEGTFQYGALKGHGWQPMTNAQLIHLLADHVAQHAPPQANLSWREPN